MSGRVRVKSFSLFVLSLIALILTSVEVLPMDSQPSPVAAEALPMDSKPSAVVIGSGFWSPYKMISTKKGDAILVISGGGESGGAGSLSRLHAATLQPLREPLSLGTNLSDIAWVGDRVLVASRGGEEIFLIDPDRWRVIDRSPTVPKPISIAPLPQGRAVVLGAGGSAALIDTKEGKIREIKGVVLPGPGPAYKVLAVSNGEHVWVSLVNGKVLELRPTDLSVTRRLAPGGELS